MDSLLASRVVYVFFFFFILNLFNFLKSHCGKNTEKPTKQGPYQITRDIFTELEQIILKFIWN